MFLDGISLPKTKDRTSTNAEKDQTAHVCRLTLLYNHRKINHWFGMVGKRLIYTLDETASQTCPN